MAHFESHILVTLSDTDAAGVVYFARFFDIAHRAMEEYFASRDLSLGAILRERDYLLPITSSSAEYRRPLRLSDQARVSGAFTLDSESSYSLLFELFTPKDELSAKVGLTHTCIDKTTWKRRALPEEILGILSQDKDK